MWGNIHNTHIDIKIKAHRILYSERQYIKHMDQIEWCKVSHSSRGFIIKLLVLNKQWLLLNSEVCCNSSAVKVKHSRNWSVSIPCIYACFSTIWLSQINLSAPWAEVTEFGHATVLWLNGSEIDIDLLVCSTAEAIHFNKKVENTAKGEQRWGVL